MKWAYRADYTAEKMKGTAFSWQETLLWERFDMILGIHEWGYMSGGTGYMNLGLHEVQCYMDARGSWSN
jgi:hypothetical protein